MRDSELSLYESKITSLEVTAKQSAAALRKTALREEEIQKGINSPTERRTASTGQNKTESEQVESNPGEDKKRSKAVLGVSPMSHCFKKVVQVDYIVNQDWEKQLEELDSVGVPVNKTVVNLLKMYTPEQIRRAIALFQARKREQHIPNPSGYFVAALKGDWGSKQIVNLESEGKGEIDTASIFRHWYDLARELGYCSSQEVREGEQWVCLSGSWEKWSNAMARGYSLEYLKKVLKRNKGS
jgi:hypothetical protein